MCMTMEKPGMNRNILRCLFAFLFVSLLWGCSQQPANLASQLAWLSLKVNYQYLNTY